MLKTKSFQAEISNLDGKRISIMRSHLIPGTLQTDPDMTPETYDEWEPELAPPPLLLRSHHRDELPWNAFAQQYQEYVRHPLNARRLHQLASSALEETVTLLSKEPERERSYRTVLATVVHVYYPDITVHID